MTSTQVRNADNTPNAEELQNLKNLCQNQLEQCRDLLGPMHVASGFRSVEVNKTVGGVPTSQHCQGLACDFVPLNLTLKYAYETIMASTIEFDQLIAEWWRPGGGWIHVSRAPTGKKPRRQCLRIGADTKGKYTPYE